MSSAGLIVDRVSVKRGRQRVVADVSFTLVPGEICTIVGPNGAGKSSLLEGILGLIPLDEGTVAFGDRILRNLRARSAVFSYMPDDAEPPSEVSVGTALAHATRFGRPPPGLADELAKRLDVATVAGQRVGTLSRGWKRRVFLFAALCTSKPVIVLDEPLATFDPLQLVTVLSVLRERANAGVALLMTVHQMADAEKIASRIVVLDAGTVVACGTLGELRELTDRPAGSLEEIVLTLLRRRESHARP